MKVIQQVFNLNREKYFATHLSILNAILPAKLTDKELEVLSAFMSLDETITQENMFNSEARKRVMKKLNLQPAGLSNHLGSMISKGFLVKNDVTKLITIKKFLIPEKDGQGYQIKIFLRNEQTNQ